MREMRERALSVLHTDLTEGGCYSLGVVLSARLWSMSSETVKSKRVRTEGMGATDNLHIMRAVDNSDIDAQSQCIE